MRYAQMVSHPDQQAGRLTQTPGRALVERFRSQRVLLARTPRCLGHLLGWLRDVDFCGQRVRVASGCDTTTCRVCPTGRRLSTAPLAPRTGAHAARLVATTVVKSPAAGHAVAETTLLAPAPCCTALEEGRISSDGGEMPAPLVSISIGRCAAIGTVAPHPPLSISCSSHSDAPVFPPLVHLRLTVKMMVHGFAATSRFLFCLTLHSPATLHLKLLRSEFAILLPLLLAGEW